MNSIDEARARIALAEMEERQLKKKKLVASARWRLTFTVGWVILIAATGLYLQKTQIQISGSEACWFFLVYVSSSAWSVYRTQEQLHEMRAELDEIKEALKRQTA